MREDDIHFLEHIGDLVGHLGFILNWVQLVLETLEQGKQWSRVRIPQPYINRSNRCIFNWIPTRQCSSHRPPNRAARRLWWDWQVERSYPQCTKSSQGMASLHTRNSVL